MIYFCISKTAEMEFEINKIEDWDHVVEKIIPQLQHHILLLKGNLGAGKTTFTKQLLKSLGSEDEVSSPTYAIVNEYHSPKGKIFHFDLYRMKNIHEVYDLGIDEYLDEAYLCIIEWPQIYEEELAAEPHHEMSIEVTDGIRRVSFR